MVNGQIKRHHSTRAFDMTEQRPSLAPHMYASPGKRVLLALVQEGAVAGLKGRSGHQLLRQREIVHRVNCGVRCWRRG